jgi:replicative DNA polymerase I (EC 2.7.7.7)
LSSRAKPYILVQDIREVDADYYVERQIVPAALRIGEVIGVKEGDLVGRGGSRTLLDFLG